MNAERRKAIAKALSDLEGIAATLGDLRDAEQEAYDNTPESLQEGEKGEAMQSAIDALSEATDNAESAAHALGEIAE